MSLAMKVGGKLKVFAAILLSLHLVSLSAVADEFDFLEIQEQVQENRERTARLQDLIDHSYEITSDLVYAYEFERRTEGYMFAREVRTLVQYLVDARLRDAAAAWAVVNWSGLKAFVGIDAEDHYWVAARSQYAANLPHTKGFQVAIDDFEKEFGFTGIRERMITDLKLADMAPGGVATVATGGAGAIVVKLAVALLKKVGVGALITTLTRYFTQLGQRSAWHKWALRSAPVGAGITVLVAHELALANDNEELYRGAKQQAKVQRPDLEQVIWVERKSALTGFVRLHKRWLDDVRIETQRLQPGQHLQLDQRQQSLNQRIESELSLIESLLPEYQSYAANLKRKHRSKDVIQRVIQYMNQVDQNPETAGDLTDEELEFLRDIQFIGSVKYIEDVLAIRSQQAS